MNVGEKDDIESENSKNTSTDSIVSLGTRIRNKSTISSTHEPMTNKCDSNPKPNDAPHTVSNGTPPTDRLEYSIISHSMTANGQCVCQCHLRCLKCGCSSGLSREPDRHKPSSRPLECEPRLLPRSSQSSPSVELHNGSSPPSTPTFFSSSFVDKLPAFVYRGSRQAHRRRLIQFPYTPAHRRMVWQDDIIQHSTLASTYTTTMPTAAITNSSNNTSALTIPITIPSTTVSSGGGSGSLNYQQQSCAQLIKFPIYGANNKIKDVKYRCSQCPNLQFKLRATAKRHVDGHYAVATQIIQCMGCNARFARSDSCKRHLATPRYSECHQPDAVGRYRVYNIAANGNRTFREYVYPITKFYGTKSTKAVMPPEHTAQLAIVEERNRKIASKFPGHMAGYRPKDLTRMVESTFGEDPEDGKGGETVLVLAEEEESDSLIQVEEPTLQDKTVQWGAPMRESKA